MTKLKKEELLDIFDGVFSFYLGELGHEEDKPRIRQACQQIKQLIQSNPNSEQNMAQGKGNLRNKSLGRLAEDLGVSFSAAKIISEHAQPEVTEEWVEKKAKKLFDVGVYYDGYMFKRNAMEQSEAEDFIRSFIKEAGVGVSG